MVEMSRQVKTEKLKRLVPGFPGYRAGHYLKTDWLLRRYLAGEVEKLRDRLADLLAGGGLPEPLREKLALSLRSVARLKEEMAPGEEVGQEKSMSPVDEERLLDFDLALEAKMASLHTPLDLLEAAGDESELSRAVELFDEGLAETDDLFRRRGEVLAVGGEARGSKEDAP